MGIFSKKPKYTPQTGIVTLTRAQFLTMLRTNPAYSAYAREVGLVSAQVAVDDCFTEALRSMGPQGVWQFGSTARFNNPTSLAFSDDAQFKTFMDFTTGLFDFDVRKIRDRAAYAQSLKGKADSGDLLNGLRGNTEPEGNYYVAPVPTPQKVGTPPVPPKPAAFVNRQKAKAWLTHGVQGDASAFDRVLNRVMKTDGTFPLGTTSDFLLGLWPSLVPHGPAYRGWNNAAYQQKYPSNVGGVKVLDGVIAGLSTAAMPARGDNAWYGLALYVLGSIVSSQAFTDGNKRMSRLAYVLMLLSGGVAIVVPNGTLGGQLGDMM